MFISSQKTAVDRPILKCYFIGYTPPSLNLVNGENNQFFNDIHGEDSAISLKDGYIELDFNVTHRAGFHARYADGDHIRLLTLGSIFFFNRLSSSIGKEIEEIDNAQGIRLLRKLISSSRDSDDLSIGFHRSFDVREKKLTSNKSTQRNYPVRICLKDIFGFAGHQHNCSYGLVYKRTLQKSSDIHVLSHRAGADGSAKFALAGRVLIEDKSLYIPQYTPNISNQNFFWEKKVYKAATEVS